ncbi:ATP-binding cassette, subfamily B [Acetitomaculum ruminis DSM 5522]|uniref:ATP-binding cassette, subfamily B n=1 Tax=Acetitomaculum ruminis DSM 5522 TaxID=1120918 RepID=A0A1I0VL80_9FIRM|nr:peptidase domain-containing ABC transporter [Acetitomaculum ruminis]SFA76978.1 ATP-binding cassette, subfamily B [Acetitomaculum ruminis DSM 5522]
MKKKLVLQHDEKDCGVACIASICRMYGSNIAVHKVRNLAKTDINGNSIYSLSVAAQALNFDAEIYEAQIKDMYTEEFTYPAIVHTIVDNSLQHFSIVYEANDKYVVVGDPALGIIKYTVKEFENIWTGYCMMMKPNENFVKEEKEKYSIKISQKTIHSLVFLFSVTAFISVISILASYYYSVLVDFLIPDANHFNMYLAAAVTCGLFILIFLLTFLRQNLSVTINKFLDVELLYESLSHMITLPLNYFVTRTPGEMLNRFQEFEYIKTVMYESGINVIIDAIMGIFALIILIKVNPSILLVIVGTIALSLSVVFMRIKKLNLLNRKKFSQHASFISLMEQVFRGIETIKNYAAYKYFGEQLRLRQIQYQNEQYKSYFEKKRQENIVRFFLDFGMVMSLLYCGLAVINNTLSIGNLMWSYILIDYIFRPVKTFMQNQNELQDSMLSIDRLNDICAQDPEADRGNKTLDKIKSLEFKNMTFQYGMRDPVLNDINFNISQGDTLGIVGLSGSGKTTLAKLIMGFFQPVEGEILVNGEDMMNFPLSEIRNRIAYVSQNDYWFQDTLYNNLTFGKEDIDEQKIIDLLYLVGMGDFFEEDPFGLNMIVEENAANLSSGEKQRLSIVKALIKEPDILIMDESTSNLDIMTENKVISAIESSNIPIKIIIAHRLHTLVFCKDILVLNDGQVGEFGHREDLLASGGLYADMVNLNDNR